MNFVGPRPALYNQKDLKKYRTELKIHTIKLGLTGWAQLNGRDELEISEKVMLDYYYLVNKSLLLDIRIVFKTIF